MNVYNDVIHNVMVCACDDHVPVQSLLSKFMKSFEYQGVEWLPVEFIIYWTTIPMSHCSSKLFSELGVFSILSSQSGCGNQCSDQYSGVAINVPVYSMDPSG